MPAAFIIFFVIFGLHYIRKFLTDVVPLVISRPGQHIKDLAQSLKQKKSELLQINAQDEFARYAKLKRRIQKDEDEIQTKGYELQKKNLKIKGALWLLGIFLTVLCQAWMAWMYRSQCVAKLPKEWLFPFSIILRYPTNVDGCIGLPAWLAICNSVMFQFKHLNLTPR